MEDTDKRLTPFLLCPRCERAQADGAEKTLLRCTECGHEWRPPLNSLKDVYRAEAEELILCLTAQNGERFELPELPAVLGRDSDFLALQRNLSVSRRHCEIRYDAAARRLMLTPLKAASGTFVNGVRLPELVPHPLQVSDTIALGGVVIELELRLRELPPDTTAPKPAKARKLKLPTSEAPVFVAVTEDGTLRACAERTPEAVLLFRWVETAKCWVVLALARRKVRLNGALFVERELRGGELFQVGGVTYCFTAEQAQLVPTEEIRGADIDVQHVRAGYDGKVVLRDVCCRIPAGRLTAILGQSGCGKSTFIKILSGMKRPEQGSVVVDAAKDYFSWAQEHQALVPQFSVAHAELTVRQCVEYAADLRLSLHGVRGLTKAAMVNRALKETGLTHLAESRVGELSGGQNKRVNIALEIVGSPSFLILDEPTTGLDYATEKQIVAVLRQMSRQGRTVLFVTHSLAALEAVDHVIVMRRDAGGAVVAAEGSPAEVRQATSVESWEELFLRMEREQADESPPVAVSPRKVGMLHALLSRYVCQWRNSAAASVGMLFVLPLLLGGMISAAVALDHKDSILFGLVAMFWLGMNQSVREIVKEKEIFVHEHSQAISSAAYLGSRCIFFAVLTLLQAVLLYLPLGMLELNAAGSWVQPGHLGCGAGALLPMLWLGGMMGTALGLLGSAAALYLRRQGEVAAVLFAVICTLPQILFSDKIIPDGLAKASSPEQYSSWVIWHADTAPVAELCSFFTISRYLYLPIEAVCNKLPAAVISASYAFNAGVLLLALACFVFLTYVLLELFAARAKR